MKLESETLPIPHPDDPVVETMLLMMQRHYDGVERERFLSDLRAKDWVILLRDRGKLCGFSTQALLSLEFQGRTVRVLFSGDTIIDRECWGSLALPLAWGRLMLRLLGERPEQPLYWLLTSKGYKTYRFLPVFFRTFQPSLSAAPSPFDEALRHFAATRLFGLRYNVQRGILPAEESAQRLKPGVADLDFRRLHDPHVAFFQRLNPEHSLGDELVCLARFHPENLTQFICRQL